MNRAEIAEQTKLGLINNPIFKEGIKSLRDKLGIPKSGFQDVKSLNDWEKTNIYNKPNADKPIDDEITTLLKKLSLESGWHHSIKRFLFLNDPDDMQLPVHFSVGSAINDDTGIIEIIAHIPIDASQAQIKSELLPRITLAQNRIKGFKGSKNRPAKNIQIGKQSYELFLELGDYNEVGKKLKISYAEAKDLAKNYKKQAGIY